MNKIKWCLEAKNGLELIEPNEDLTRAYISKAEDALRASAVLQDNRDWEISSAYYTQYFSLYAILMKIGVKCEIHSCSINFMKEFLKDFFTEEDIDFISKSQKARNDMQYYSDRNISNELYVKITKNTSLFLAKSKEIVNNLTEAKIEDIRSKIKEYEIK